MKCYPGAHLPEFVDKPAAVMANSAEQITYGELDAYANRLARLFQWLGLQYGEHVAFCLENRLECIGLQWGAHYAGLYYTFVSTRLKGAEAAYIVGDCDARVMVVTAETAPQVVEAVAQLDSPPKIFCLDDFGGLDRLDDACMSFDASPVQDTLEGSEMLYSSGTTGVPKGVKPALTGQPLGSTCVIAGLLSAGFSVDENTVYLSPAPYYHAAPLKWSQGVTALGGTVVLMQKFNPADSMAAIDRHHVTHSQWVPTMFSRLLALPDEIKNQFSLSSHKVAVHAAAPCPIPVKQAMIDWWGQKIVEYYSCTETIGMTLVSSKDWVNKPGTVGRSILGQVKIVDESDGECAVGEDGLVYFSDGPQFSYHKDEEKTSKAYNRKGWATVGDIGYVDEDGFLYLTDRQSNMIITGGVNVYPQEVENLLIAHPKVYDAAVIGVPDQDLGEEVRAVIQLENGIEPSESIEQELITYTRAELSAIKCPRSVDFSESLPREPNGKLLKRLLKAKYQ